MEVTERDMFEEEQQFLQRIIDAHPTKFRKMKMIIGNGVITWCAMMLLVVICWLIIAWLVRKAFDLEIGWDNNLAAVWIVSLGGIACLIFSTISTARWVRGWTDIREPLRVDIENQRVNVEKYEFCEAIRMQEPEHLGLMYFMREDSEAAFVYFDSESQDLGVQDEDPLRSSFVPRSHLSLVRAPESRVAIESSVSGDALDTGDPVELTAPPELWPEHEEISDVPWSKLTEKFAG